MGIGTDQRNSQTPTIIRKICLECKRQHLDQMIQAKLPVLPSSSKVSLVRTVYHEGPTDLPFQTV